MKLLEPMSLYTKDKMKSKKAAKKATNVEFKKNPSVTIDIPSATSVRETNRSELLIED